MKKYVSSMLAGALVLGLAGCGSGSSGNFGVGDINVTFAELNATGVMGYHINVDLDFANNTYDASNIDYYFCTDAVGSYDYYAYTQDRAYGSELLVDEPDFDYGYLAYMAQSGTLEFTSNATGALSYDVNSSTDILEVGATYDIDLFLEAVLATTGTVHINSIANFDCTVVAPTSVSK
ncbi:hypothetical protein [Sulfurimonas diazotrophicus]|uniref:DUF4382 domain-containing protein n=1 Tax=Sulfurimonas diazotrophicus TaxID=3131939 RepID=A0ABZ3H777_9BACT